MTEDKGQRIGKVAREYNISLERALEFLASKGEKVDRNPNTKLNPTQESLLAREFGRGDAALDKKEVIRQRVEAAQQAATAPKAAPAQPERAVVERTTLSGPKVLGRVELDAKGRPVPPARPTQAAAPAPTSAPAPAPAARVAEAPKEAPAPKPVAEAKPEPAPVRQQSAPQPAKPEIAPKPEPATPLEPAAPPATPAPEPAPINPPRPAQPETVPQQPKPVELPTQPSQPAPTPLSPSMDGGGDGGNAASDGDGPVIRAEADKLKGLTIKGKIELPVERGRGGGGKGRPGGPGQGGQGGNAANKQKRERTRIKSVTVGNQPGQPQQGGQGGGYQGNRPAYGGGGQGGQGGGTGTGYQGNRPGGGYQGNRPGGPGQGGGQGGQRPGGGGGGGYQGQRPPSGNFRGGNRPSGSRSKYSRDKRDRHRGQREGEMQRANQEAQILRVTEFVSVSDLASLMDVNVNAVIGKAMGMGMFVSINQRLDADVISMLADEFGFEVQFTTADEEVEIAVEADDPEDLVPRAPIVTIMGHVDHGKTSLLDYIRKSRVAAGEAGGITQHIGAYSVTTESGRQISFLDTPGHEAFTAMRARGASVTDVAIIVIAADDAVMPQTREAITHAQNAGVPIVFAFNKIDKPGANAEKIREELAQMNILVEEWGGKYQTQEISAKQGLGVWDLLEKVLLEADLLDLKANPDREASGTVIEAALVPGRGYEATFLVQNGTLRVGDVVLAGPHFGRVRAMTNHRGERLKEAGPSMPVRVLGLPGAPQAGDKFNVMENEREAREIAQRREQIMREQSIRTRKHITLDEIGRRLAIGSFKQLNVIVKGDVDGSVEALSDSLLRLSTTEVEVNILFKGVGQISESDVLLASASDAIIVGFQVRPSPGAKKLAEHEEIEIRLYSIIYDAINEIKTAMEGMLAPTVEDVITGNVEVREVYNISRYGKIAGCYVTEGTIKRNSLIRVIRDGIVVHSGKLSGLKRFKDDVSEVKQGFECGISLENFSQIDVGDTIEAYELKETKRTLA